MSQTTTQLGTEEKRGGSARRQEEAHRGERGAEEEHRGKVREEEARRGKTRTEKAQAQAQKRKERLTKIKLHPINCLYNYNKNQKFVSVARNGKHAGRVRRK